MKTREQIGLLPFLVMGFIMICFVLSSVTKLFAGYPGECTFVKANHTPAEWTTSKTYINKQWIWGPWDVDLEAGRFFMYPGDYGGPKGTSYPYVKRQVGLFLYYWEYGQWHLRASIYPYRGNYFSEFNWPNELPDGCPVDDPCQQQREQLKCEDGEEIQVIFDSVNNTCEAWCGPKNEGPPCEDEKCCQD